MHYVDSVPITGKLFIPVVYIIEAYRENLCYSRRIALFSRCTGNQLTSAFKNGGNSRNDKNNFFLNLWY